jgi:hypothetical protein
MKYGKYWLPLQKLKENIANVNVLELFIPKIQVESEKKNPSVTRCCRRCRPGVGRYLFRRYLSRLKGYRFEISATFRHLGWIDAPHTQNFEISRVNLGVKKISF